MYLFEGLKTKVSKYLPQDQVEYIQAAYILARDAHDGQTRSSGDPYITHPVAVAGILADMNLDYETLMAALLHDVIEDTHYSRDDLTLAFGETVAELVDGADLSDVTGILSLLGQHKAVNKQIFLKNIYYTQE